MTSEDLEPRRSRRRPVPGTLVEIELVGGEEKRWVVDAVDLSADGMGLVLPNELKTGNQVRMTFRLDDGTEISRVSATVQHREPGVGGVHFAEWPEDDRLALLEYLVHRYEHDA